VTIRLYDYWRSSAAYRVRIALNLKGLAYESVDMSLANGAHLTDAYKAINPQQFIPLLEVDGHRLTQSIVIIDYLDTRFPEPRLIPAGPAERARVMALALIIACDIHPLNNLRVLKYQGWALAGHDETRDNWYRHWITEGFDALEAMADPDMPFLSGTTPSIADICLIPQIYNARRFGTPLDQYPTLLRVDAMCTSLTPFKAAHPDAVRP
jgi:maleylacetoacetate isomerase